MGQFDSPIEGFLNQHKDEPRNIVGELCIEIGGKLLPLVGIGNAVLKLFSSGGNADSVRELAATMKLELQNCWEHLKGHDKQLEEFRAKLASPAFEDATLAAIDEARWTSRPDKIRRISAVLVRSFLPVNEEYAPSDVVSLIRDVARLGEDDIFILRELADEYSDIIRQQPNFHDQNPYTEKFPEVLKRIEEHKIHRDDFYAQCARSAGFGFAIEVMRNNFRMAPNDYCFRPTRRGIKLLEMIDSFGR
ncbi:MAG: hypothetical protein ABSF15_19855 [Candidatus Sulfotelmatobacter sp.]|jgi:hypothetical protein